MFAFLRRNAGESEVERLAAVLVDQPATSFTEVYDRCCALDGLAALGPSAALALPAIHRTFTVPVRVDCVLMLRVAAAVAAWKVGEEWNLALPILTWALKDERLGVTPRAVEILSEIGHPAVVPDLAWLVERRVAHGPFSYERFGAEFEEDNPRPLLALVAEALGRCGGGLWNGLSYRSEAIAAVSRLTGSGDARIRVAALRAFARLGHP